MLHARSFVGLQATVRRMAQPVLLSLSCGPKDPILKKPSDVAFFIKGIAETQVPVLVNVAAYIRRHTIQGFDGYSSDVATKKAQSIGDILTSTLSESLASYPNVEVVEWETLSREPRTRQEMKLVKEFYSTNPAFREEIDKVAREFVKARCRNQNRSPLTLSRGFTASTEFLLEEFACLYHGLTYKDDDYRLHLYPTFLPSLKAYHQSALNNLLFNVNLFGDLSNKLVEKDKVQHAFFVYSLSEPSNDL